MSMPRIGVGGPVGSGKTSLLEAVIPWFVRYGYNPVVITNDIVTQEDARHVRENLDGILDTDRIVGVETGACPHTAIREDPTMNLGALNELERKFPDADMAFIESGGDNLTLTFSPALVDYFVYVIDVAAGDKIPRKNGPGITHSDLLVINKTDLAPLVDADLTVMDRDARAMRPESRPTLFTNCKTDEGVLEVVRTIARDTLFTELPDAPPVPAI
ncbi:MAG: urease accessory protein UreG [Acidimicrobiales bacterium]